MDFYDYIINRNAAQEKNPGKLSSYRQAAELICLCWNRLDMSFVEPYLDEDMVWKGGVPHRVINGKDNFLKLMSQVFDSLQYSKRSYRADVDGSGDRSVAIITVDGEYQDMMHRLKIEDGLIKEIEAQLSRLIITKDYRILLPDYNNIEVKMEPLVKAVYLLFLKHPEGILFKGLTDYREEMLDIYKKQKPMGLNKRTIQSIEDVTNPLLNSINEKCARIRSAFVKEFDESLAKNYFVTGERGEAKKIALPRDLVNWE